MQRKFYYLLWVLGILVSYNASAQQCATEIVNQRLATSDPAYQAALAQSHTMWQAFKNRPLNPNELVVYENNDTIYEIPVVVHVMHSGENEGTIRNPSNAVIANYINYLNETFAATWSFYVNPQNGGVKFPVRFKLAQRTPGCNPQPTTGIVRVNAAATFSNYASLGVNVNATSGVSDSALKSLSRWDRDMYYNIWLVNYIDGPSGTVGGYAYYPGVYDYLDGTVLLVNYTTPFANGSYYNAFPHEIGHAFGLKHTFEGSSGATQCPPAGNCNTTGDEVCDTEPHPLQSGCPTGLNICTNANYVTTQYNIMNYTNCANRFTNGQKERFLFHLFNYRSSLIHSLGATPIATSPNISPIAACIPTSRTSTSWAEAGPLGVKLGNLDMASNGYTFDGFKNYRDYTCGYEAAKIKAGSLHPLTVITKFNTQHAKAWIDFNNNGVFETAELVMNSTASTANFTHISSVSIPSTAVLCTPLRMRVSSDFSYLNINSITPCIALTGGQHEDYTVIIEPNAVTPTATISSNVGTTICNNQSVTLTANVTNANVSSLYLWYKNGNYVASGTTYTINNIVSNDQISFKVTYPGSCALLDTVTSNILLFNVVNNVTPNISILAAPGNTVCDGQLVTFQALVGNQGSAPTYQWKVNGNNVGTNSSTYASSSLQNGDVVTCVMTSSLACVNTPTATSNAITMNITSNVTPTITISASQTNLCIAATVNFTATITNGGTAPNYQWKLNGNNVGTNASTFSSATLQAGDTITCELTSSATCAASNIANSNAIVMTNTGVATPSITIVSNNANNEFCEGSTAVFQATVNNGGTAPVYQWKLNGNNVGTNSPTYSSSTLVSGDIVRCEIVSNAPCLTTQNAVSNNITVQVIPVVDARINITASNTTICQNSAVDFNATVTNGGASPEYQWKVNGVNVAGATNSTFSTSTLANGDNVTCVLTSNATCVANSVVESNTITMQVTPSVTASVSVSSSAGTTICSYDVVTLQANTTNAGNNPSFVWRLNNTVLPQTTSSISLSNLSNGDVVNVELLSNAACVTNATTMSNDLIFTVTTPANVSLLPDSITSYCTLEGLSITLVGANGAIQWYVDSTLIPNQSTSILNIDNPGVYYATNELNGCIGTSNHVNVVLDPLPAPIVTLDSNGIYRVDSIYDSYVWYFNNQRILEVDSNSHRPHAYGNFYVCVTLDDCRACSEVLNYADPLGIDKLSGAGSIKVYPNPTKGWLQVDYTEDVVLEVRSIDGRMLKSEMNTKKIDVSDIIDGVYMLYIHDKNHKLLQINKFIKN